MLERVSKNCHILLCYVSDNVFIAYGYAAMINSQSLRGHWGLQWPLTNQDQTPDRIGSDFGSDRTPDRIGSDRTGIFAFSAEEKLSN